MHAALGGVTTMGGAVAAGPAGAGAQGRRATACRPVRAAGARLSGRAPLRVATKALDGGVVGGVDREVRGAGEFSMGRRTAGLSLLAASAAGTVAARPARAGLFGDGSEEYTKNTMAIIEETETVLTMGQDDPALEAAVEAYRGHINTWVAKYRRDDRFAGRPSYGQMYTTLNAIAGHYVQFGAEYPIPAKRLERIVANVKNARRALEAGR